MPPRDLKLNVAQPLADRLAGGLEKIGLELDSAVQAKLLAYLDLLAKWNRIYNLTAVRKPEQMLARHLFDSLVIHSFLRGPQILDVGSGAGLPGIPLALACPGYDFTLLDSNSKKTRFITQAAAELGLSNVTVVQSRIDAYTTAGFDTIVSRAFSSLAEFARAVQPRLAADGILLAMKGVYPGTELAELPSLFRLEKNIKLQVPDLDAERNLLIIQQG
ncbi:16S rRNA (guanine(527)-N(7))-methyltransferase [hydrothermal vent metagenome]|uniref:16S rRNA (Guanine(527)-N(7))-methyltransferase n=1 Tax=hydrothermal vent metagenome TaxID=652676 RepID=A0A3B1BIY3_9ZZZZ